jgi:TolA-binding protein
VPDVTYVAAESQLQVGRSSEARKLYDALLRTYPAHADAPAWKVRRGLSLYLEKDYAGTIAFLQPQLTEIRHLDTLAEACYLVGASQAELKQFPPAIRSLEASLAAQPRWRQADETLLVLAYAYRHENRLDQAIACLGRLIQQFPASGARQRAHFRLAEYAYAAHDLATAARHYQEVLDHPGQAALAPHALLGLAWTRLDGNAFAAAEEAAGTLLAKYPADKLAPRAHYVRGMARQQLRKFAPALDDLRAFLASQPGGADKSDARYVTALCQVGLQRGADAAATLENLLREEPAYAGGDKALYELAWAEQSLHREREAAEAFRRLAQGHPHSPLAAESGFLAAEFDYRQGHFAAAAEGYRRAITVAGITAIGEKAAHRLGWACFRQNDFAAAQQAFARQCAAWPDGPLASDAAFMQAESLGKLGRFAEALAAYDAVKHPRGEDFGLLALVHGAAAAAQSAQWEKSRDWCLRAGQQFPDTKYLPEILYQQAWAQQNLGHLDEALRLYAQAIAKSNPDFPDCAEFAARSQFMIGQVHARQGQFAEALKSFNNVVYGYSYPKWTAEATYEAARCYEKLGKKAEAIGAYEKLLADHPGSDKAAPAKARLAELKR